MTITTTDKLGVYTTHVEEAGFKADSHADTLKKSQIKALGKLLNKMAWNRKLIIPVHILNGNIQ